MLQIKRVLISDDIDDICPQLLRDNGVQVTIPEKKLTVDQLKEQLTCHDALIVRSATKVTADVIKASKGLKLIGRAGTGVDNIDLKEATEHGIIVMNTPTGNSRSAAELSCTMIMSLSRRVPQAHQSMKEGRWDRKKYMGAEVYGKTLAVIGLGRIGRTVAERMQAFGMKTIGFDPMMTRDQAAEFGVEWMPLEEIWPLADYVTLHVPLVAQTANMVNSNTLAKCKKGVCFVNCARGGIINEPDLIAALDDGQCGGAAFDVFIEEPPTNRALVDHPLVISTPHLGASTTEAQERVAEEIADNIVQLNSGTALLGALNAGCMTCLLDEESETWAAAARDAAQIVRAAVDGNISAVEISYPKSLHRLKEAFKASALVGLLKKSSQNGLNLINSAAQAKAAGITSVDMFPDNKGSLVTVSITSSRGETSATVKPSGTGGSLLFAFNGLKTIPGGVLCSAGTTVAICEQNNCCGELNEQLQSRVLLSTGARCAVSVVCFERLDEQQIAAIPVRCAVVNF